MREGTPRIKSKTHTSTFVSSIRSNAMLFSSGDNRTELYPCRRSRNAELPPAPIDPEQLLAAERWTARHVGQRAVLRNGESADGFGDRKRLTRQCDRVRIEWLRHQRRFTDEQQVAASAGRRRDIFRDRAVGQSRLACASSSSDAT